VYSQGDEEDEDVEVKGSLLKGIEDNLSTREPISNREANMGGLPSSSRGKGSAGRKSSFSSTGISDGSCSCCKEEKKSNSMSNSSSDDDKEEDDEVKSKGFSKVS